MLWRCDGCGKEEEADPSSHSDWGGVITVQGPDCEECEQPMDFVRDTTAFTRQEYDDDL